LYDYGFVFVDAWRDGRRGRRGGRRRRRRGRRGGKEDVDLEYDDDEDRAFHYF